MSTQRIGIFLLLVTAQFFCCQMMHTEVTAAASHTGCQIELLTTMGKLTYYTCIKEIEFGCWIE